MHRRSSVLEREGMQVVLRTITMPAHIDASGHIPGGWLLWKLDQAGAVLPSGHFARPAMLSELAAVEIFARPGLGEHVSFLARPLRMEDSRADMLVEGWGEAAAQEAPRLLIRATACFVPGEVQVPENLFPGSFPV